jgi:hypothetical protein
MERLRAMLPLKIYVVLGDYAAEAELLDIVELNGKFRAGFIVLWNGEKYNSIPKAGAVMLAALQERYLPIANVSTAGYNMWERLRIFARHTYFRLKDLFPSEVRRNPDLFVLPDKPTDMEAHEQMVAIIKSPECCLREHVSADTARKRTLDKTHSSRLPVTLRDLTPYMTILTHHFKTMDVSELLMAIRDFPPKDLAMLINADAVHIASVYKRLGKSDSK